MDKDAQKWNRIFSDRPDTAPAPPAFADHISSLLRPGTVLDIASGDGALTLHLAARGFTATAVDISRTGLDRLQRFAALEGLEIATRQMDLDDPRGLGELDPVDNITIARFKPSIQLWPALAARLKPGGRLALITFSLVHHQRTGFSRRFCLAPGELEQVNTDLHLCHYRAMEFPGQFLDSYLFEKRG